MKVFMTGATGFVGSFLAERLVRANHEVKCLVRKQSNLQWIADLDVECYYGSLTDPNSLIRGMQDCDLIYHVAGVTKARTTEEYFKGNYEGTKNIVDAALKLKNIKRFILVSSQTAVGPSPTIIPIDEKVEANPITDYGRSKRAAEEYVLSVKDKMPITIVRPPAVYGPRDTDILEFFRTVKFGIIPQLGGKEKYLSLIHVRDLVRGIIMAAESEKAVGETYFITSREPYAWSEISRITLKILQKRGFKIPIPIGVMKGIAWISEGISSLTQKPALVNKQKLIDMEQDFWTCAADKAPKELGFGTEISLENGIRETLIWYKEQKWL
ncbi:MAG: NAD-dependent epimerase/dehydratase family protein [Calditrichales bacterium]|nr:MAG: NAD-dependent epimerase/dehydratase family protein [Calditrichales bacterium]